MGDQTKFNVLCSLFTWMQRSKSPSKKRTKFRKFLDAFCKPHDYFSSIRLILPNLDRERCSYGLKESVLATCLIDALGVSRESEDAIRLINWRKGGAKTGANAGNFALVAAEVLQRRQGMASGGLTIKELNDLLDQLASSENRAEKTIVLSTLIRRTNAQEMKWVVMIILKDLKLGISEKSIFHEFHPDAEDLFNVTCDLKLVCEKLRDRNQRHRRQDIEVGKAVRPQLAMRVANATAAWKKLHGREVVVECKFDGDRIQIHKNGSNIHFFSRNFLDHSEYQHGMLDVVIQNILVDRCILDGEMLVWDTSLNRFAEFGSNQEIAKAAKDGLDNDRQLCYVAFDILYVGDTSVIHRTLKERHELLCKVVKPVKGRFEILIPDGGLNTHLPSGEPSWSIIAHSLDDVEKYFKETIENRDEGIVLKDLNSKWEPSDRSGKWLKLKPDYVRAGSDLDVLIIGGYYGSGRRGGDVAQFLVGLAERPDPNTRPRRFISFCRVGTGLSGDELDALVRKLKPYFRKYEKKTPPNFYQVTNNSKERPDVWVDSPEKSVILSITSDIRTIHSEVFAAPYSLRFPRIDRVRYEKPWYECLDVQSFVELVHSSNGTTKWGTDFGGRKDSKSKRVKSSKSGEKKNLSIVPSHLIQTDVSVIKGDSLIFSNMMFCVNVPPSHSLVSFHKMVAENGGTLSMNLNNSVTHCVAADSKGFKFEAAKRRGDIIHYSWVLQCCSQKKLVHLQPKYFLFLSESTKKKLQEEIDEFSDSYYWDLDLAGIKQLLSNMGRSEDLSNIEHYRKKYCPKEKWSYFLGCCICFHTSVPSLKQYWDVLLGLLQRRLKLEVLMGGGTVSDNLAHATHLVVFSVPGYKVNFDALLTSFTSGEKSLLWRKRLCIVGSQWLEGCVERKKRLSEDTYSLRPCRMEDSNTEKFGSDMDLELLFCEASLEKSSISCLPTNGGKQSPSIESRNEGSSVVASLKIGNKRRGGRPARRNLEKLKSGVNQAQGAKTRARITKKPAKILEHDTDGKLYDEDMRKESIEEHPEGMKIAIDSESSERGTVNQPQVSEDVGHQKFLVPETKLTEKDNNIGKSEKGEIGEDPIQAMLFNMIPSLGIKKVEDRVHHDIQEERPQENSNVEPVKKKKVSYKDVASELLSDD